MSETKQKKKKTETHFVDPENAYVEGWNASFIDQTLEDNPYTKGSKNRKVWIEGFKDHEGKSHE